MKMPSKLWLFVKVAVAILYSLVAMILEVKGIRALNVPHPLLVNFLLGTGTGVLLGTSITTWVDRYEHRRHSAIRYGQTATQQIEFARRMGYDK